MVFWFFKKKDDHEIHKLKENLNHSFSNIKNDIQSVHNVLKHFKEKHERHDEKHNLHNERFNKIEDQISRIYEILAQNNRHSSERSIVHERSIAPKLKRKPYSCSKKDYTIVKFSGNSIRISGSS